MGKRRHYTDDTAPNCWLCDQERGLLCHVHDPAMRKHLAVKDGYLDDDEPRPDAFAWTAELAVGSPR
jgi:hypothetical protein